MRACNVLAAVVVSLPLLSGAAAEDSLWNLSMPTIESPSLGTGFYTPPAMSSPFISGAGASEQPDSPSPSAAASASQPSAGVSSSAASLSRRLQNSVSARDMETLHSLGLLGGLSGILSEGYRPSLYSASSSVDRTEETNRLLTRVLEKMEEIKVGGEASRQGEDTAGKAVLAAASEEEAPDASGAGQPPSRANSGGKSRSRLLRFAVNGYNVLRTCRTVYISDVQDDGTFLVTGDRRYVSDVQTRSETFHILFKTKQDTME